MNLLENFSEINGGAYSSRAPQGGSNNAKKPDMFPSIGGYTGKGFPGTTDNRVAALGLYSGGKVKKRGGMKRGGMKRGMKRGGKSMKRSRKSMKRGRKSMKRGRKSMKRGRKSMKRGRKSMKRGRKSMKRGGMKGGNRQPFSNKQISFGYTLDGGMTPYTSALASPMPYKSILNC
jgi:hypothetical protein